MFINTFSSMIDPVRVESLVALSPSRAFDRFTRELRAWWPREYTWSQGVLEDIGIEPRLDGLCFEIGPHGFHCDWGRVLAWEPPTRLQLAWQIGPRREPVPDPKQASSVVVTFTPTASEQTKVLLVHDAFERHGAEAAAGYRTALASDQGWPFILRCFAESAI